MSTQVHATVDESTVREISESLDEPEWLLQQRLEALSALEELEMPDVIRTPGRDWTDLAALDFESLVDPLNAAERKDQVGPEEAEVLSFAEALSERPELVEEEFGSVVDPQRDYLTALSTALFTTGTVVYVPERVNAEDVTVRTEMNSRSLFNYTLVVTETSTSVTVLERQSTGSEAPRASGDADEGRYYSGIVEVVAGENSHVQYGALQDLSEETYNYQVKRGAAPDNATVSFVDGNLGSRLTKSSVETELVGQGSEARIVGAFFGQHDQHFDIASRVWHRTEHTTADLVTRGVLDDTARSVYEGVQDVGRDAWDTSSYQRENTLMLSEESEADASPKLIINNHDTEASHSATVGQIDEEELFYMLARGVGQRRARNMLVEGFFVPVLDEVEVEELREDLQSGVAARLREDTAEAKAETAAETTAGD
jgi:Fe-S cluster assembly protein SufD